MTYCNSFHIYSMRRKVKCKLNIRYFGFSIFMQIHSPNTFGKHCMCVSMSVWQCTYFDDAYHSHIHTCGTLCSKLNFKIWTQRQTWAKYTRHDEFCINFCYSFLRISCSNLNLLKCDVINYSSEAVVWYSCHFRCVKRHDEVSHLQPKS